MSQQQQQVVCVFQQSGFNGWKLFHLQLAPHPEKMIQISHYVFSPQPQISVSLQIGQKSKISNITITNTNTKTDEAYK